MHHDRDWKQYNQNLINRGKIHFWIQEKAWKARKIKKNGAPFIDSDEAMKALLYLRFTFSLSLRQLQGFVSCYTQVCRRMQKIRSPKLLLKKQSVTDVVLDTTGLKVYGRGE